MWSVLFMGALMAQVPTTMTLAVGLNPAPTEQTITLSATVTPTATGTVMFLEGFNVLGSAILNGSAVATVSVRAYRVY